MWKMPKKCLFWPDIKNSLPSIYNCIVNDLNGPWPTVIGLLSAKFSKNIVSIFKNCTKSLYWCEKCPKNAHFDRTLRILFKYNCIVNYLNGLQWLNYYQPDSPKVQFQFIKSTKNHFIVVKITIALFQIEHFWGI